jgi:hypothetical protein
MAVEAASGLYHLHCEGVIHRVPTGPRRPISRECLLTLDTCAAHDTQDIAARNCLVGENYHIFVTDFG